ncbi:MULTISPECIES: HK97-gp10 family putative phage morphogenesis protein [unclassified Rhizobium]|uniref:HK97-gp10 family putative phage morphogenesis protein n=1 Tax=unclassified Rhizobium TaxID=2613769 RepID=UPI001AE21BE9|nr:MULTISPECIES: HK97-gp10 family putative phage morphogenesis protein [unclassified Rhizobium]MBP2459588.1 HK97 gp10 family phage protein [Rhizobium sp. PvP014]MBP2531882.1 HK97 gp10 family phage protein [Rhizobium sp. PvP099]
MSANIVGLRQLQKKLDALPRIAKVRIREAMEQGANEIVNMAKSLVPAESGALRDSIGWTYGRAPKGAMAIGSIQSVGGDLTITIYAGNSEAFYARWVEFGTSQHTAGGKFAGATIPGIPASPYFYVSFRANRKRVRGRVTRAINRAAKEVAAG